jgi:hypothetical protein
MKDNRSLRFLFLIVPVVTAVLSIAGFAEAESTQQDRLVMELSSHPVRIYYESDDERVARRVAEICEDRLDELSAQIGLRSFPPVEIEVADDIGPYRRRLGSNLPTWGVAFALMREGRMVVDVARATRAWNSLETVIPHELSHLYVAWRTEGTPLPVWFLEGLAQWQADEWTIADSWQLMSAVWSNQAPKLWQLQNSYPTGEEGARAGYRVSYAAFTYLFEDRFEDLPAFLEEVARLGSFEDAFIAIFGEYPTSYYVRFHEHLHAKYRSRLLVFQSGPLFSILAAAFLILAIRYHIRKRKRLERMSDGTEGRGPAGEGMP